MNEKEIALLKDNQLLKLQKEVEKLKKSIKVQKYGIVWADVPEAFEDDVENKLPVLEEVPKRAIKSKDSKPTHILIEGDNYHALTCLNYTHKGKVDVIYIDPPYNTGNDGFRYKDRRILDKFPDGTEVPREHPFRHSYWLSFMKKRLELAKTLLKDTGVIFISIGNDEVAQLKLLCDEIFVERREHNIIHWKKNQKPQNASNTISESAEFLLVYFSKTPIKLVRPMTGTRTDEGGTFKPSPLFTFDDRPRRIQVVPAGTVVECKEWKKGRIDAPRNQLAYITLLDAPKIKNGVLLNDVRVEGQWRKTETNGEYQKVIKEGRLFINSNGFPNEKSYRDENSRNVHTNLWLEAGYNELGKQTLDQILGRDNVFPYPKPVELVKEIIKSIDNPEAVVLDFFAGSGTTAQAVLEKNEEDDGRRQFILVTNNENKIMEEVCYPRIKGLINGYDFSGKVSEIIFEEPLTFNKLKKVDVVLNEIKEIEEENKQTGRYQKITKEVDGNKIVVYGEKTIKGRREGLGSSVKYYRTGFVGKHSILDADDKDKIQLAYHAGEMLSIAENTLNMVEKNEYWQLFEGSGRCTAVYFREEYDNLDDFVLMVQKLAKPTSVYIFSWEDDPYMVDFEDYGNVTVKTIPQPILEIYKQIYNLL
jgi:adenine-specific DNA-methyltransferase